MSLFKTFPRVCAACALLGLLTATAFAQDTRPRTATSISTAPGGATRLESEPSVVSLAPVEEAEPPAATMTAAPAGLRLSGLNLAILDAIEGRLGTPYRLGAEGPNRYDCSGFVWSVFQEVGVTFERGSARTFWSQFAAPTEEEKYKFGTLVFFNHLGHVGIVADANGFYHASSSRGVVYSPFNDYWAKRIVGFRRVPPALLETAAAHYARRADLAAGR
jgi:peptidoglycan endopeptidase LytE